MSIKIIHCSTVKLTEGQAWWLGKVPTRLVLNRFDWNVCELVSLYDIRLVSFSIRFGARDPSATVPDSEAGSLTPKPRYNTTVVHTPNVADAEIFGRSQDSS